MVTKQTSKKASSKTGKSSGKLVKKSLAPTPTEANENHERKAFVLDTNVPLSDPNCLESFGSNDIYIPITVLEEVDNFKKGHDSINANARHFLKKLAALMKGKPHGEKIALGHGLGYLSIALGTPYPEDMEESFSKDIPDHRILAITRKISESEKNVFLITGDNALQAKAWSFGLNAEPYTHDTVQDMSKIYDGIQEIVVNDEVMEKIQENHKDIPETKDLPVNTPVIVRTANGEEPLLVRKIEEGLRIIDKNMIGKKSGISAINDEQYFAFDALCDSKIILVSLTGKAGTGKTLLALAAALELQKKDDRITKISILRPVVQINQKNDLGFLPGDLAEKLRPYMQPIRDNLEFIIDKMGKPKGWSNVEEVEKNNNIEIEALNLVRGRTLPNQIIIVDEAQNATPHEIKTIISRAGKDTKVILCGDLKQVDSPYLSENSNGLAHVIDRMKGQKIFAHIPLRKGERSELAELAATLL